MNIVLAESSYHPRDTVPRVYGIAAKLKVVDG
jgi:hypothetical protein